MACIGKNGAPGSLDLASLECVEFEIPDIIEGSGSLGLLELSSEDFLDISRGNPLYYDVRVAAPNCELEACSSFEDTIFIHEYGIEWTLKISDGKGGSSELKLWPTLMEDGSLSIYTYDALTIGAAGEIICYTSEGKCTKEFAISVWSIWAYINLNEQRVEIEFTLPSDPTFKLSSSVNYGKFVW